MLLVAGGYFFGNFELGRGHMSSIALLGIAVALLALTASAGWNYFKACGASQRRR